MGVVYVRYRCRWHPVKEMEEWGGTMWYRCTRTSNCTDPTEHVSSWQWRFAGILLPYPSSLMRSISSFGQSLPHFSSILSFFTLSKIHISAYIPHHTHHITPSPHPPHHTLTTPTTSHHNHTHHITPSP